MSENPIPQYGPREKNLRKLIIHLSLVKETTTIEVLEQLKVHERTVIRLFRTLTVMGLAIVSKKERREGITRGKPMTFWKATFEGLMLALFFQNDKNRYIQFLESRKKEIPAFIINSIKQG